LASDVACIQKKDSAFLGRCWYQKIRSLCCDTITRQGARGTNWSIGSSNWKWGRWHDKLNMSSLLWGWQSTGTSCPEGLWSLLLWRYSEPTWTQSSAACFRWP